MAAVVTMKQLIDAGVHFGHQTRRWNPKMQRFIHGEQNGIYIIDLEQTLQRLETAYTYVRDTVADTTTLPAVPAWASPSCAASWRPSRGG